MSVETIDFKLSCSIWRIGIPLDDVRVRTGGQRPTTDFHPSAILRPMPSADPKSVKVHLQAGTGVNIEWKDGHLSQYPFPFLRDACPCALCDEERSKTGREPGESSHGKPGELPMFKAAAKPVSAEPVGKYALKFKWNDGHELGIYSWQWLRQICPCEQCTNRKKNKPGL